MNYYERKLAFRRGHSFGAVLILLSALLFGSVGSTDAQSNYNWQGNSVDKVLYKDGGLDNSRSEDDPNKVVFLQHVGTGKWLRPGGAWGTQLSLGDVATELWICKESQSMAGGLFAKNDPWSKDYYFINTALGTNSGSWMSNVTTGALSNKSGLFMDDEKGTTGIYSAWNFVDCGNGTYAISSREPNGPNTKKSDRKPEDSYLYYDAQSDAVVLKKVANLNNDYDKPDVDALKADKNDLWRIVTMADIYKAAETTSSASMSEPFNVTFLVKDQGLDRGSAFNTYWKTTAEDHKGNPGLKLGVEKLYSSEVSNSDAESRYGYPGSSKSEREAEAKENGQYFCGQVRSDDGTNFHQTITIPRTGWYRVSCQGFTDDTANRSYLFATCDGNAVNKGLADVNNFDGEGTAPTDLTEAGKMFRKHQYSNTLYIYAKEGSTLDMGIEFRGANSWTAFDDFQLAFCGNDNPQLVLDETKDNLDYITNANSKYNGFKGAMLYLHRKMDADMWNTIVLPVSLTMGQCRDLFGNNTQIARFTSYSAGHIRFDRVENENTDKDEVVIEANVPYVIKPTRAEGDGGRDNDGKLTKMEVTYQGKDNQPITVSCTAPYATTFITNAVDTKYMGNQDDLFGGAKVEHDGLEFHGTLVKTFEDKNAKLDLVGKYIIYNGKIYHVVRAYGLNGMRGYFAFTEEAPAKISVTVDGETVSSTTGIDQLFGGNVATTKQGKNVYNINGQLVNANGSLSDLPKGVYIVNGKKYVMK